MVDRSLSQKIAWLNDRIAEKPHSRLFVPLAEAYLKSNRPDEAISVLTEGIKNNPTFVAGRVLLGKIYREKKAFSEAKFQFGEVVRINHENIPSLRNLAIIYREEGDDRQAMVAYRDILNIDPSDKEARVALAILNGKVGLRPLEEENLGAAESLSEPEPVPSVTMEGGIVGATFLEISEEISKGTERPNPFSKETGSTVFDEADSISECELPHDVKTESDYIGNEDKGNRGDTPDIEASIATPTLANLLMDQGSYREAADTYRRLLAKNPSDIKSKQGLESALAQLGKVSKSNKNKGDASRKDRKIRRLQSWLAVLEKEKKH